MIDFRKLILVYCAESVWGGKRVGQVSRGSKGLLLQSLCDVIRAFSKEWRVPDSSGKEGKGRNLIQFMYFIWGGWLIILLLTECMKKAGAQEGYLS